MFFLHLLSRSRGKFFANFVFASFLWTAYRSQAQIAPSVSGSPPSQNLGRGLPLNLRISANPFTGLTYQWFHDGSPILGATNSVLSRISADFTDTGIYFATAANLLGSVTSAPARVTIVPQAQLRHVNTIPLKFPVWVKVINGIAYIADGKLEIYDVSDPRNPIKVGFYDARTEPIYAFFIDGKTAYVNNDQSGGLISVDLSNPALPVRLGFSQGGTTALDLVVRDGFAYCATDRGMEVFDVSNPRKPILVSTYNANSAVYTIEIRNKIVFLATIERGVQLVDVTDPIQPHFVSSLNEVRETDTVKISGNRLYVSGMNFAVYDITSIAAPRLLGVQTLSTTNFETVRTTGMSAIGNFMFTGYNTLRLYEAANPQQTALISELPVPAEGVDIVGNHIYVAGSKGVEILEWVSATNVPVATEILQNTLGVESAPARLMASASGGEELNWQWFKEGIALPGETNRFLNISGVTSNTIGEYSAQASNGAGTISVGDATLSLASPPPLDLSIRLGDSRGTKLDFSLPEGFQTRLESSDLTNWNTIWSGQSSGQPIEIFDASGKNESKRFYRLKYGLDSQ